MKEAHSHGVRKQEQEGSSGPSTPEFNALKKKAEVFHGLEVFPAPEHTTGVSMTSDEVTALCPVTGQPDQYIVSIHYIPVNLCLESKSLKLYLHQFRNEGVFCEALADRIAKDVFEALSPIYASASVSQKSRGGISIKAQSEITLTDAEGAEVEHKEFK